MAILNCKRLRKVVMLAGVFLIAGMFLEVFAHLLASSVNLVFIQPLALGMVLVKTVLKYPGSLLLGIPAALLGAVVVMLLAEPLNLNLNPGLILGSLFILVPLAGTTGYHLRR